MTIYSLTLASVAVLVFGQPAAPPPAFEVASVKPSPDDQRVPIGLFTYAGGRIVATKYTLKMLICDAYNLELHQILGAPRWADEDRFNIEAKPPASSESSKWVPVNFKTPPNPEMRRMLQTLLADRFQLKAHAETKRESVYALVVAKGGPKLKEPTTSREPFITFGRTGPLDQPAVSSLLTGYNATMAQLVERLTSVLRRPVFDHTGLKGNFDFQIEYVRDSQLDTAPPLLQAIQEQLGLKLETQPGTTEALVIDHAEKPSGN